MTQEEQTHRARRLNRICYEVEVLLRELERARRAVASRLQYLAAEVRGTDVGVVTKGSALDLQLDRATDLLNEHLF